MRRVFMGNPWASSIIRGKQIAERIGGIYGTDELHADDVMICVKCCPSVDLIEFVHSCYVDIVDSYSVLQHIKRESLHVKPIAIGKSSLEYITTFLGRSDCVLLPEHHCNWDNIVRNRDDVKTVGFCGYADNFQLNPQVVADALADIGLQFVMQTEFPDRESVVNFYQSIDIQLCYRPQSTPLKNPLKVINAGSFRIPTVAFPERNYVMEVGDCFLPAVTIQDVVDSCRTLKESKLAYQEMSERSWIKSREYHIDSIAKLYKERII